LLAISPALAKTGSKKITEHRIPNMFFIMPPIVAKEFVCF